MQLRNPDIQPDLRFEAGIQMEQKQNYLTFHFLLWIQLASQRDDSRYEPVFSGDACWPQLPCYVVNCSEHVVANFRFTGCIWLLQ